MANLCDMTFTIFAFNVCAFDVQFITCSFLDFTGSSAESVLGYTYFCHAPIVLMNDHVSCNHCCMLLNTGCLFVKSGNQHQYSSTTSCAVPSQYL